MKKHFNRSIVMTKDNDENFDGSTECWIYHNTFVDDDIKV